MYRKISLPCLPTWTRSGADTKKSPKLKRQKSIPSYTRKYFPGTIRNRDFPTIIIIMTANFIGIEFPPFTNQFQEFNDIRNFSPIFNIGNYTANWSSLEGILGVHYISTGLGFKWDANCRDSIQISCSLINLSIRVLYWMVVKSKSNLFKQSFDVVIDRYLIYILTCLWCPTW